MLAKESYDRESREFRGQFASTKNASIENAYDTALRYLDTEKIIKIDDYHASTVTRLKQVVFRSDSWAMLFQDTLASLRQTTDK